MNPTNTASQFTSGIGGANQYGVAMNIPTIPTPVPISAPKVTPVVSSGTATDYVNSTIVPTMNSASNAVALNNAAKAGWSTANYAPTTQGSGIGTANAIQPYSSSSPTSITPADQAAIDIANTPDNNHIWIYDANGNKSPIEIGKPIPSGYSTTNPVPDASKPVADTTYMASGNSIKKFSDGTYGLFNAQGQYIQPSNPDAFNNSKGAQTALNDLNDMRNNPHLRPEQQAQVDAIKAAYQKMIDQKNLEYQNLEGSQRVNNALYGGGDPNMAAKDMQSLVDKGSREVADITSKMNSDIGKMQEAFRTGNLDELQKTYTSFADNQSKLQKSIDDTHNEVLATAKADADRKAAADNALTNDINTFQAEVAKAGGAENQQAYNTALANRDYSKMVEAAGNILTGGVGGEYNLYRKDATARGIVPVSFDEYQNRDANRKARIAAAGVAGASGYTPQTLSKISPIVNNFDNEQSVKNYQVVSEGKNFVDSMPSDTKNPADQQAFIYAFAKIMDPNSVVREGEYATVQKYAQAWAESFGFSAKRIFSNSPFLTQEAINNMKNTISSKAAASEKNYKNIYNEYGRRIDKITGGKDGTDFITDYSKGFTSTKDELLKDGEKNPLQLDIKVQAVNNNPAGI